MHDLSSPKLARAAAFALVATLMAACGGGGSGDTSGIGAETPAPVPAPEPVPAPSAPAPTPAPTPTPAPSPAPSPAPGGANASVAGALSLPNPTLENLTVEWAFSGDANANAQVSVRYRAQGSATWSAGMPLRRTAAGSAADFSWTTRHSGSVFGLSPATIYELELTLTDPDGGSEQRLATARTRAVPAPMAGATVRPASASTLAAVMNAAQPGDIIELAAGSYSGFTVARDGSEGKPIVIRAATRGSVVINGEVGLFNRNHVQLDGLTVNGRIRFNGSNNVAITRCAVNASASLGGDGIVTYLRAENAYIADNVVTGTTAWADSSLGVNGNNLGEGILVTGPGHVIQNNRVVGFRDGISFLEGSEAVDQYSIDVLNNDIEVAADDGVEADFCRHNCRIMRNRITNVFVGLSSQPGLGGPTYFVRNVLYNVAHVAFKLYRESHGDVLLHNTVVKSGDALGLYAGVPIVALYSRNNLLIGGPGGTYGGYTNGSGRVIDISTLDTSSADMNYDALGSNTGSFGGRLGSTSFSSLAQLRSATGEKAAVEVGLGAFAVAPAFPSAAMTRYAVPDLRPAAGGAAVDAGVALPGINDGFSGSAPDAGAYELGAALPLYGPR